MGVRFGGLICLKLLQIGLYVRESWIASKAPFKADSHRIPSPKS